MNSNLNSRRLRSLFLTLAMLIGSLVIQAQKLSDFNYLQTDPMIKPVKNLEQFNGYTKYWHNNYSEWFRYGNLFKIGQTDVEKTILQSKLDIAEELGLPGLLMQEGGRCRAVGIRSNPSAGSRSARAVLGAYSHHYPSRRLVLVIVVRRY